MIDDTLTVAGKHKDAETGPVADAPWKGAADMAGVARIVVGTAAAPAALPAGSAKDLFRGLAVESIDLSNLDASKATSMEGMFMSCRNLRSLDLSGFDTSSVGSMSNMFYGCSSLASLDLSGFETSSVSEAHHMFAGCKALKSLDLSGFKASHILEMFSMFEGCSSLVSLDLSGIDTSKVLQGGMDSMFSGCDRLAAVRLGKAFGFKGDAMSKPYLPGNAGKPIGGTGLLATGKWVDPKGNAHDPSEVKPSESGQGEGWYLAQPQAGSYALFDWGARNVAPSFVKAQGGTAAPPSPSPLGREPARWLDAAGSKADPANELLENKKPRSYRAEWALLEPAAAQFSVSPASYDGSRASVAPANGLVGKVAKVRFETAGGEALQGPPSHAGSYVAHVDCEAGPGYEAATGLAVPFEIKKRPLDGTEQAARITPIYLGSSVSRGVAVELSGGAILAQDAPLPASATVTSDPAAAVGDREGAAVADVALPDASNYSVPAKYELVNQPYEVVEKKAPAAEDFDITIPPDSAYDGGERKALVEPADPAAGLGGVTVLYSKDGKTWDEAAPVAAGAYQVAFDVAEGAAYKAAMGLPAGSFAIAKRALGQDATARLPPVPAGTESEEGVRIVLSGGGIVEQGGELGATADVAYGDSSWAGSHDDATVSGIVPDDANYTAAGLVLECQAYEVPTKAPSASDFKDIPRATYAGAGLEASIAPNEGVSGMGKVSNVRYRQGGAELPGLPVDAGTYEVTFDVEAGDVYEAATGLDGGEFVIEKRALDTTVKAKLPEVPAGTEGGTGVYVELSGGNIVSGTLPAEATTEYPSNGKAGTHADGVVTNVVLGPGAGNYSVPAGYELVKQEYTVPSKTPTEGDFDVELPEGAVFDGAGHAATVEPKAEASGIGKVSKVLYSSDGGTTWDGAAPVDAGTYLVSFDVEAGDVYEAAQGLDGGSFAIAPLELDVSAKAELPPAYAGAGPAAGVDIELSGGGIPAASIGATADVAYDPSAEVGTGYATVANVSVPDANYEVPDGYELPDQPYTVLAKAEPKPADFKITIPPDSAYDGDPREALVSAGSAAGLGAPSNVRYSSDGGTTWSPDAPSDAGTYEVAFDVAEGAAYKSATGLEAGKFTIAPKVLDDTAAASIPGILQGTKQTTGTSVILSGGSVVGTEQVRATASTIDYPGGSELGDKTDATVVVASLDSAPNYALPSGGLVLKGQSYHVSAKPAPTAADFDVAQAKAEYDGSGHGAVISPHDGVGAASNVRYLKGSEVLSGEPVDAGTYAVMFDVAEGERFAAAKGVVVDAAVVISPRLLDATMSAALAPVRQGDLSGTGVPVALSGGRVVRGQEVSATADVSCPSAGKEGSYSDATVKVAALASAPNYALPQGGVLLEGQSYEAVGEDYPVLEGGDATWTKGSGEGLRTRIAADYAKSRGVLVDGEALGEGDYAKEEGSTIVTLKPAFLETLAAGPHVLRVEFSDGAAEVPFTIAAVPAPAPEPGPQKPEPQEPGPQRQPAQQQAAFAAPGKPLAPTGDPAGPLAAAAASLAALALAGAAASRRARR